MKCLSLFCYDPEEELQDVKQKLVMTSGILPNLQNNINRLFSLEMLKNHMNDPMARTIIEGLFLQASPYMDINPEEIISKINGNYPTILFELVMFQLLKKEHAFNLIARNKNAKKGSFSNPDFSFNNDEDYFECTTRTSSLVDYFFKLLPKFKSYLLVAQLFVKKQNELKTIYTKLENTFWDTSIDCLSHEFNEIEKQKIVDILDSENFEKAKDIFKEWIYYVRYALMFHKNIFCPTLINELEKIGFPIGFFSEDQDNIARSLQYTATFVTQALIDKMEKGYFRNNRPVTVAISFSLRPDYLRLPCPLELMNYLKEHLSNLVKAQLKLKEKNDNFEASLQNIYAIILDTCWYNWLPDIAIKRHGAKFNDGYTNNYACLYNINHSLVKKGSLIYSGIPHHDFVSINV